jgi:hypothetical protein
MRAVAVSLILDWLKDWRVELALSGAIAFTAATLLLLMPAPLEEAARPVSGEPRPQSMTVDARTSVPAVLVRLVPGNLPPPVAGQRKPPCHPIFEKEFSGGCWLPLAVEECPAESGGHLHEGKCYLRALAPERQPSSGEPSTRGVAEQ